MRARQEIRTMNEADTALFQYSVCRFMLLYLQIARCVGGGIP